MASHPESLSGQLGQPLFCSSVAPWKKQRKWDWVFQEEGWERTSCYKAVKVNSFSRGCVQSTRKVPAKEVCSASSLWPSLSDGGSKSNERSGAWRLDLVPWDPEVPEAAGQRLLTKRKRSVVAGPGQLGIDEGDCDVAGAFGGGEPLVVVRESPGVHESPALPWGSDGAVVAQEPTASALGDRRCQFPNRKHQFPNGTLGPSPTTPILPSEPSQPRGSQHSLPGDALQSDGHELPKEDTQQRARDPERWPCREAALGSAN